MKAKRKKTTFKDFKDLMNEFQFLCKIPPASKCVVCQEGCQILAEFPPATCIYIFFCEPKSTQNTSSVLEDCDSRYNIVSLFTIIAINFHRKSGLGIK